jgi:glutamate carboxypeptidase
VDLQDLLDDLSALVNVESPSSDVGALAKSAAAVADLMEQRLGSRPAVVESAAGPHVHWNGGGEGRVLLVGHHDTVFPAARSRSGRSPSSRGGRPDRECST